MFSDLRERDEALPSLPLSVFTEKNILSNLFIVQKNVKAGNASKCMVVLLFSVTISKKNNKELYLLTCRKCRLLVVGLSDTYLHE